MTPTPQRILVFVPMYNCERQIPRVLERIGRHLANRVHEVVVIDNGSRDRSREVAEEALRSLPVPGTLLGNDRNYNLGGSHKVAFRYAIAHGFDWVVVVHGDDQAEPADLGPLLDAGTLNDGLDALLGSRFCRGARRIGYPWHRTWGNRVFNVLFSVAAGRPVSDLGSGLNAFRVGWLAHAPWANLADDLTFNIHLLLRLVRDGARIRYVPITWREEDQVSNVRLFRQAWRTIGIAWGYFWLRGSYLGRAHALHPADGYTATVVYGNDATRAALPAAIASSSLA